MLVLECLSAFLSKKQTIYKEKLRNYIPQTNEHLRSTAREIKPYLEESRVRPLHI
jgi:hypothetical protein